MGNVCQSSREKELEQKCSSNEREIELLKEQLELSKTRAALLDQGLATRRDFYKEDYLAEAKENSDKRAAAWKKATGMDLIQQDEFDEMSAEDKAKARSIQDKIAEGKLQHLNELPEEKETIDRIFKALDTDGNGTISPDEATFFFPKSKNLFESMDFDHDGQITKAEFYYRIDSAYDDSAVKAQQFMGYLKKTVDKKEATMKKHADEKAAEAAAAEKAKAAAADKK